MLARLTRELPRDGFLYEPKWDGFRALVFRDGIDVDIRSRHRRPLARYFPELAEAFLALPGDAFVLDGEIVVARGGRLDFPALMARLHPVPSRVERLCRETPASFVGFDLLGAAGVDLRDSPFTERRTRLEDVLEPVRPPLHRTPITDDADVAAE
jgi:ATP-dependent DNA ligase